MKISKKNKEFELEDLFFIFVLGTISFLINLFELVNIFPWEEGLKLALNLVGFVCYEIVIIFAIIYYFTKLKLKFKKIYEKYPQRIKNTLIILISFTYLVLKIFKEKSWLNFFSELLMIILVLWGLLSFNKWFEKQKKNGK